MAETVACPACNRNNGLKRTACMYCGEPLPVTDATAGLKVPTLVPVEEWHRGYSVVVAPLDGDAPGPRQVERLAEIVRMEPSAAAALFDARVSLPVARVGTLEEANLIAFLLGEVDLGATVVADEALALDRIARRVREVRFHEDHIELLVLWGEWTSLARDEIVRAVEGRIVTTQVEIVEGAGRKRKEMDLVDTAHYFSESYLIDLYGPSLDESFRVKADSFDFACLGARPSPRIEENVAALGAALARYVGASRYDASFRQVARLLDHAWPAHSHVASRGIGRRGDMRRYLVSSLTTDALGQFTRYSRLRYVMGSSR